MTTFLEPGAALLDIPDLPDRGRMYREIGERLRAAMRDKGVDALVLLGNGNVVYATGASWPLLDEEIGRASCRERVSCCV